MCPQPCLEGAAADRGTGEDDHRGLPPWVSAPLSRMQQTHPMLRLGNEAMALPSAPSGPGTPAPASCTETFSLGRHIPEFRLPPYGPGFHPFLIAVLKRQLTSTILAVKRETLKKRQVQAHRYKQFHTFICSHSLGSQQQTKGNMSRVCCLIFVIRYSLKAQIHPPRKQQKCYR